MSLVALLAATHTYNESTDTKDEIVAESLAWEFVGGLSCAWLLIFCAFLLLIKEE